MKHIIFYCESVHGITRVEKEDLISLLKIIKHNAIIELGSFYINIENIVDEKCKMANKSLYTKIDFLWSSKEFKSIIYALCYKNVVIKEFIDGYSRKQEKEIVTKGFIFLESLIEFKKKQKTLKRPEIFIIIEILKILTKDDFINKEMLKKKTKENKNVK